MRVFLRAAWAELLPSQPELGESLLARWSAPNRHYHGVNHLIHCLEALDGLGSASRTERLAIWFHDVVHTNTPGLDERLSAQLARQELAGSEVSPSEVAEVARLVMATFEHQAPAWDLSAARVIDADLAILGSSPQRYLHSVTELRAELADLTDAQWRQLRVERLNLLLSTPLYQSAAGRRLWEAQAQANLAAERGLLSAAGPRTDRSAVVAAPSQASKGAVSPAPRRRI